tara:strand:+ start:23141 stop:25069 length:1929 start_codon:yes stop_codon:yes gene_type:complete
MKLTKILLFVIFLINQLLLSQTLQELERLQSEYNKALDRQALQKPSSISKAEETVKSIALPDKLIYSRKDVESLLVNTEKLLEQLRFFEDSTNKMPYVGYDFFTKRDSIPFWQNIPISKNYVLGAGDEVIISVWGESNSTFNKTINRDGQIFLEKIGVLYLSGKSLEEAKQHIISKFSRVYSTLLTSSPKSFIDLTLGELKSINVHFVGYVNIPGVHIVHPFSNVISGLIQAGGVDNKGSLRNIKIIRNNELISTLDLYDYLIKGKSLSEIRLMDQDIIYVPSRKSTVSITGRILNPGYYEILDEEKLDDLIKYAGGRATKSSNYTFVYKDKNPSNDGFMLDDSKTSNFSISEGDSVHIPLKPDFKRFVNIQGKIKNPGKYPYNPKMKMSDLLNATMSIDDKDFYQSINLSNITIFRKNPADKKPLMINTSIEEDISLKNGDLITIRPNKFFEDIESIKITGEINIPGIYPVNNLTTLSNIIEISGGFTNFALKDGIEIYRDSLRIGWLDKSFILKDGDSLNVLKKSGLVLIEGEVNVPGYVSFKKNESVKKYINKAGGFTSFAEKKNIYIIQPNGISMPISSWRSPKVKEGSTIIVNQRKISGKEDISGWEAFSLVSSQAGNIATTLLSLSLIINQNNSGN